MRLLHSAALNMNNACLCAGFGVLGGEVDEFVVHANSQFELKQFSFHIDLSIYLSSNLFRF